MLNETHTNIYTGPRLYTQNLVKHSARGENGTPKGTSIDPGEEYKPTIQLCVDLPMKANALNQGHIQDHTS